MAAVFWIVVIATIFSLFRWVDAKLDKASEDRKRIYQIVSDQIDADRLDGRDYWWRINDLEGVSFDDHFKALLTFKDPLDLYPLWIRAALTSTTPTEKTQL